MLRALIIEDEKPLASALKKKLESLHLQIVEVLDSVQKAQHYFEHNPEIDLIFSDIQLGDGLSFEIFENREIQAPIIFTTAFDQYTLEAFKLNSIDYILKPIQLEKLKLTLQKYESLKQSFQPDYAALLQQFTQGKVYKNHFLIKVGNYYQSVESNSICALYSENKLTYLQTEKTLIIDESLTDLEQQLNPNQFFRINRQMLVNRIAIQEIKSYLNSRLQLQIQNIKEPVIVSRERVSDFKNWLQF